MGDTQENYFEMLTSKPNRVLYWVCHKSINSSLPDDYQQSRACLDIWWKVNWMLSPFLTSFPPHKTYPATDPVHNHKETQDQVLKARLEENRGTS